MTWSVECAAKTDVGLVRRNNQDSFGSDAELQLFVVCDGMGGAAGGEVASRIAVDVFLQVVRQELSKLHDTNSEATRAALRRGVAAANRAVLARASVDMALHGMGSTLVAARLVGQTLTVVNVGDSRAYLFRDGQANQLTRDHSWVVEQVQRGLMTATEAEHSTMQSIITRAIGAAEDVAPEIFEVGLQPGDTLLLTSDGLTRHVQAQELAGIIVATAAQPAAAACEQLIALAKARGGSDNITCYVVRSVGTPG